MSKPPLPNNIDPRRLADQGISYEGSLPIRQLERFGGSLVDQQGEINIDLSFGVDEERIRYMSGTADVKVQMQCQRCMKPVTIQLQAELNLGIVKNDEAARGLPKRYDPLIVTGDELDINRAIEDELILTLPLIPTHDDCVVKVEYTDPNAKPESDEKENPFSILAQFKGNKH